MGKREGKEQWMGGEEGERRVREVDVTAACPGLVCRKTGYEINYVLEVRHRHQTEIMSMSV